MTFTFHELGELVVNDASLTYIRLICCHEKNALYKFQNSTEAFLSVRCVYVLSSICNNDGQLAKFYTPLTLLSEPITMSTSQRALHPITMTLTRGPHSVRLHCIGY